jgi:hypothetical protein
VNLNGVTLPFSRGEAFYRIGATEVPMESVHARLTAGVNRLRIQVAWTRRHHQVAWTTRHHEVSAATRPFHRSESVFPDATRLTAAVTDLELTELVKGVT